MQGENGAADEGCCSANAYFGDSVLGEEGAESFVNFGDYPLGAVRGQILCCDPDAPAFDDFTEFDRNLICHNIYDRSPCLDELRIQLLIIFAAQIGEDFVCVCGWVGVCDVYKVCVQSVCTKCVYKVCV